MVTFSVFWIFSALYLFVDFTGRPKWALQYKIQDGINQPVSYQSFHRFHTFCWFVDQAPIRGCTRIWCTGSEFEWQHQ